MTNTGGAQKTVCWPAAATGVATGVAGLLPGHDIDTAYTAGDTIPVYMTGSRCVVWVRYKTSGGALVAGSFVSSDGLAGIGEAFVAVDSATEWNLVGRCTHWHDDIASDSWVQVRLGL